MPDCIEIKFYENRQFLVLNVESIFSCTFYLMVFLKHKIAKIVFTHCYLVDAGKITTLTLTQPLIFATSTWEVVALNHFYFRLLLCKANCFAAIKQSRVTKTGNRHLRNNSGY